MFQVLKLKLLSQKVALHWEKDHSTSADVIGAIPSLENPELHFKILEIVFGSCIALFFENCITAFFWIATSFQVKLANSFRNFV